MMGDRGDYNDNNTVTKDNNDMTNRQSKTDSDITEKKRIDRENRDGGDDDGDGGDDDGGGIGVDPSKMTRRF